VSQHRERPLPFINCVSFHWNDLTLVQHYGHYLSYYWANDERTRDALGIKKGTVDEWVRCRTGELPYTRDIGSSIKYHRNVTANGYRALVYRYEELGSIGLSLAEIFSLMGICSISMSAATTIRWCPSLGRRRG
jgi:hypothetical protein